MQKITPFLTYQSQAEEAVNFYVSLFNDAKILHVSRYGEGAPLPAGTAMSLTFQLEGQQFMALNGGAHFTFSDGISLYVDCETQAEVDELWRGLTDGGEPGMCGWLKDPFGVSWQIIPRTLGDLLQDTDPQKAQAVMQAMLQMSKIDIASLKDAYEQA